MRVFFFPFPLTLQDLLLFITIFAPFVRQNTPSMFGFYRPQFQEPSVSLLFRSSKKIVMIPTIVPTEVDPTDPKQSCNRLLKRQEAKVCTPVLFMIFVPDLINGSQSFSLKPKNRFGQFSSISRFKVKIVPFQTKLSRKKFWSYKIICCTKL